MHRFFTAQAAAAAMDGREAASSFQPPGAEPLAPGTLVSLPEADAAHAARVLRLAAGDAVIVCDGRGFEYEGELASVTPRQATARIKSGRPSAAEPSVQLVLAQSVGKGDKMDLVVQKAVEIGVSRIIPLITARTVVRLDEAKAEARVRRWRRIAYEAAKQSGRARVPLVADVHGWDRLFGRDDLGLVLVPWEGERSRGLLETVRAEAAAPSGEAGSSLPLRVTVVIGPEGGLTAEETALARRHGAYPVTLGPRILRTETAGLVAAALVLGALGELG